MRFFIIICLLFTSFSVSAQQSTRPMTPAANETIDKINDFISEEIEEEWAKHVAKLMALAEEIKAAKFKLRQVKLETILIEHGETPQARPPYTLPSDKCEERRGLKDSKRCVWYFKNSAETHMCENWWINEIGLWYQESAMECKKMPTWTRDDTGEFGYQAPLGTEGTTTGS
jgi:hypothetical protein